MRLGLFFQGAVFRNNDDLLLANNKVQLKCLTYGSTKMSEQDYAQGDLVWAKLDGHPYWPSLVCKSPQENTHSKITKQGRQIHVQFFATPTTRAWVKIKSVKTYKGKNVPECKPGGMFYSNKKSLWSAVSKAEKAEFMTMKERMKLVVLNTNSDSENTEDMSEEEAGMEGDTDTDSDESAQKLTKIKKRKAAIEPVKPNKRKKTTHDSTVSQTFIIGKSKVPEHWKTAFVLMNTNDVPEDLTPDDFIKVPEPKKRQIKLEIPDETDEINDLDSEDELEDSDADPGWTPDQEMSDVESAPEPEEPDDADEESLDDSDDDWAPRKGKKTTDKRPKQFGLINRKKSSSKSGSNSAPQTSLKTSDAASSKKSTPWKDSRPTAVCNPIVPDNQARNLIITDNTPTAPEPEVGDFVLEKAECKDGNIPFLWRYKRGGLIQKYERMEEDGKVFYQNVLSFSDWWACFAHKYQKVETQVLFKYRNVEKVTLIGDPVVEEETEPAKNPAAPKTASKSNTSNTSNNNKESTTPNQPADKMQEQEISSTTQESHVDIPEPSFQIGQFVLDMKDKRNVDNFPIWKIESQILLKKYEAVIKNGRLLHKPVKTYRGYREISKHYLPVKVNRCLDIPGEEHVEVTEDTKPKITVSSSMEEEYEKNPLLRHFYVYMQVFLSQALEPGFLDEVMKTNDPTYMFPLGEIDKIVEQKAVNIERKVKWMDKIKDALKKCPYLREVNKPDDKRKCEALVDSDESVDESVFLFGSDYDKNTLKQSGNSHACQEFKIGKTAVTHISTYHQLCHFKYNLYDKCLAKIKLIRDSKEGGVEVEKIMDECLGNKSWVLQNFEDFMTLVEMT
ncbi:uncharacterized protein LOC123536119 [Mercenaria mercenaria]|uniref:uncharacterized protein LOC123536119 n=1 Tax=Mercenaria mercenaria TaxID=6596 RepID=UPI00234E9103|nr:uncharacterized protein LOC123536119 [Mercenaria mercenaria]